VNFAEFDAIFKRICFILTGSERIINLSECKAVFTFIGLFSIRIFVISTISLRISSRLNSSIINSSLPD